MSQPGDLLRVAEQALEILKRHQLDAVVIGAVALAAHHYVRQTEAIDLGVVADLPALRSVVEELCESGLSVELRAPDGTDPLGGVFDVSGEFGLVQVITYAGRFPAVIEDAISAATLVVRQGSPLRIVPVPQLIALKLCAGGYKSKADIVERLVRNPGINLDEVRAVCSRYLLQGLEDLIAEARLEWPPGRFLERRPDFVPVLSRTHAVERDWLSVERKNQRVCLALREPRQGFCEVWFLNPQL
jgi:hypothetical protein